MKCSPETRKAQKERNKKKKISPVIRTDKHGKN